MVHLTCSCMNIRLHLQEPIFDHSFDSEDSDGLKNLEESEDPFLCSDNVALVNLAIGGITKEHDYLCSERSVGQWIIYKCAICSMDAYATNKSGHSNQILVNLSLEGDENRINFLKNSSNYSQVFGVVLPQGRLLTATLSHKTNDNSNQLNFECTNAQIETGSLAVKNKMSRYLLEQQSAMEERIRSFTERQHSEFAQLQLKIGREKDVLISILNEIEAKDKPVKSQVIPQKIDKRSNRKKDERKPLLELNEPTCNLQSNIEFEINGRSRAKLNSAPEVAFGGVFEMEGLEIEEGEEPAETFEESDGDDHGCYNSSDDDHRYLRTEDDMKQYATSLPIKVPVWTSENESRGREHKEESNVSRNYERKFKEQSVITEDPANIAESIQQMVTQPSNEVFGALPRRRLNTGDLVRSRLRFRRQEE